MDLVNLIKILNAHSDSTLEDIQLLQKEYDRMFVDSKFTGFDKVRHTYAHLGKLMGRMAEYIEATEERKAISPEDIKSKVIPDLIVYAAWLANEFGVNLEEAYLRRFIGNLKRLHADEVSPAHINRLEAAAQLPKK